VIDLRALVKPGSSFATSNTGRLLSMMKDIDALSDLGRKIRTTYIGSAPWLGVIRCQARAEAGASTALVPADH